MQLNSLIFCIYSALSFESFAINNITIDSDGCNHSIDQREVVFRNDSLFIVCKGKLNFLKEVKSNGEISSSYKPLLVKDELFLVSGLGGSVYREVDSELLRIDNSFEHKNQLASSLFVKSDTIFRFGGYGFFDTRNFFTYFSEETKEWEVYVTKSIDFPKSRMANQYALIGDQFYILGGSTINLNNRNFSDRLDDIWKFSFKSKAWKHINNYDLISSVDNQISKIFYDNRLVFKSNENWYLYDFDTSKMFGVQNFDFLKKIHPGSIVSSDRDSLYFIIGTPNSKRSNTEILSILKKDFEKNMVQLSGSDNTKLYVIGLVIFLLVLVALSYSKLKSSSKKKLILMSKILSWNNFKVELDETETEYIQLFISNEFVENRQLLDSIPSDLDISQKTRIKNAVIRDLNNKLNVISSGKVKIIKTASIHDRRYSIYLLSYN